MTVLILQIAYHWTATRDIHHGRLTWDVDKSRSRPPTFKEDDISSFRSKVHICSGGLSCYTYASGLFVV